LVQGFYQQDKLQLVTGVLRPTIITNKPVKPIVGCFKAIMKSKRLPFFIKILLIHAIFLVLHYLYDWFPNPVTTILSRINESVYQHMKIGFFSYLVYVVIEFLIIRKSIISLSSYFYARLFATTYFPLVMMVIYLIGPLAFGNTEIVLFEIIFANLALLATSFSTLVIEAQIEKTEPGQIFRFVIIALFVISFAQYIVFTYQVPWFDIFAIPPGY
jgi:hypothetical protein